MNKSLVGYSGFVGSNLSRQTSFNGYYNSANVEEAYGSKPDLLVYAGVRSEKYLANHDPEKDLTAIRQALNNIEKIEPAQVVLISTVDVYKEPREVTEETIPEKDGLHPYGLHRLLLEEWVESCCKKHLVVRLPALFGCNLKKNFIYDLIHKLPAVLNEAKYSELSSRSPMLAEFYRLREDGFYACRSLDKSEKEDLLEEFEKLGFSAEHFTDSRSVYQFFNLDYLWSHIDKGLNAGLSRLNLATEPVGAAEIYRHINGKPFINEIAASPAYYDFRTGHGALFGRAGGYLFSREQVLADIKRFVLSARGAMQ